MMNHPNDTDTLPEDGKLQAFNETERLIFQELLKRHNLLDPARGISKGATAHYLKKIRIMIDNGQPIMMTLPAFPGKSPNRKKTLSYLPDLAESIALEELSDMCRAIQNIYSPGAVIEVCSDGYVFSDLVYIPNSHVKEYTDELERLSNTKYPGFFRYFDLRDAYPDLDNLDEMRERLTTEYAEPLDALTARTRMDDDAKSMYRGITRFLFEDYKGLAEFDDYSNSRIQKQAREFAYRLIQRSNAWSGLLQKRAPGSVRLSIHPQASDSLKFGIKTVPCHDAWRTPWHSVALKRDGEVILEKRSEVEATGCRLMFRDGRPSYYVSH